MGFFSRKKKADKKREPLNPDGTCVDPMAEIRRLKAENENLRMQLQQHWEIIYQYEKQMTERRQQRRRHHHHRARPDTRDVRIQELEQDNRILSKYVISTNKSN